MDLAYFGVTLAESLTELQFPSMCMGAQPGGNNAYQWACEDQDLGCKEPAQGLLQALVTQFSWEYTGSGCLQSRRTCLVGRGLGSL